MSSARAVITLAKASDKDRAHLWIDRAPQGTRVEFKGAKRTLPQNDRMWAMLTDVATQKLHAGRRYSTRQWKALFMHACGAEIEFLPTLDGANFLPWSQSSSDLSIPEMSDLIEFMFAWGAEHGIAWSDPKIAAQERAMIEREPRRLLTHQPRDAA